MKLLVINPNTSDDVTALIEAEALRSASSGTDLVVRTAGYGVEYIETRFESLIAAGAVAEIIAEYTRGEGASIDGVVVAAFGDPGMPALKELTDIPVIGITEAEALHTVLVPGPDPVRDGDDGDAVPLQGGGAECGLGDPDDGDV